MTYLQEMRTVFGWMACVLYAMGIFIGLILFGLIFSFMELWYVGIPMVIGGIFILPTITRVWDRVMSWMGA